MLSVFSSVKSISSSKWSLLVFASSISVKFTIVIVISLPDISVDSVTEILVIKNAGLGT